MNKRIKIAGFSILALTFLLSPGQGALREMASCGGGFDAVQPPTVPFGTDWFEQVDSAAWKASQQYFSDYLGQATTNFLAMRKTIRNGYGLDMPANYQNPNTTPTLLSPTSPPAGVLSGSSPAFQAFTPLAMYGTTNAFQLPTGNLFAQQAAAPSLSGVGTGSVFIGGQGSALSGPVNTVTFQR